MSCGQGPQPIKWLGHVGIARWDEENYQGAPPSLSLSLSLSLAVSLFSRSLSALLSASLPLSRVFSLSAHLFLLNLASGFGHIRHLSPVLYLSPRHAPHQRRTATSHTLPSAPIPHLSHTPTTPTHTHTHTHTNTTGWNELGVPKKVCRGEFEGEELDFKMIIKDLLQVRAIGEEGGEHPVQSIVSMVACVLQRVLQRCVLAW